MIRVCLEHGYYDATEGDSCPGCGEEGNEFLNQGKRVRLSKLMSGALRHFPDDLGLSPDGEGWVGYDGFVESVGGRHAWVAGEHVRAVIETDPKGRFELRGGLVRASYGHSIDVEIEGGSGDVPDVVYHGTAPGNVDSILEIGIRPMDRQMVHLSPSREDAVEVGRRHSRDPVVVVVDSEGLVRDGYVVSRRGATVFTVQEVPPPYIVDVERGRTCFGVTVGLNLGVSWKNPFFRVACTGIHGSETNFHESQRRRTGVPGRGMPRRRR